MTKITSSSNEFSLEYKNDLKLPKVGEFELEMVLKSTNKDELIDISIKIHNDYLGLFEKYIGPRMDRSKKWVFLFSFKPAFLVNKIERLSKNPIAGPILARSSVDVIGHQRRKR